MLLETALSTTIHVQLIISPITSSKPALLFLHYWGGSSRTFHHLTTALSKSYTTIALDHRGWGLSKGPDHAEVYSTQALANDVLQVLKQLEEHTRHGFVIVGHSMGAKVALAVATSKPPGLRGIVLIAPAPPTPFALPEEMREQQIHAYDSVESISWTISNVLAEPKNLSSEDFNILCEDSWKGDRWAKAAWPAYAMGEDISMGMGGKGQKVLVLAGEHDVVETKEKVEGLVKLLDEFHYTTQFHVIPGVKHLIPLENPSAIVEFIEEEF
ncbi:putative alpha/beta hydrolase [Glonium stellatum]|uniref:Putative alpha/beta hydrolase n=1 Tax=Glonium stellatum TaxID=574774 RepID=A0A8E2JVM0_9PEZI|nr:putative alpha/beta hydrolase [Glonium stellatum]